MVVKKLFSSSFGEDEAKNLIMKNYRSVVTGIDNACENGGLDFAGDLFEVLFGDARGRNGHEAEGIGSLFEVNGDLEFSDLVVVMEFKAGLVNS